MGNRVIRIGWSVLVAVLCTCQPILAQSGPSRPSERGAALFSIYCSACHGEAGDGRAPAASALTPPPRDFTQGLYKFRSTPSGSLPTDEDLERVITQGIPKTWMPGWGDVFSNAQIHDISAYLKTLLADEQEWVSGNPIPIAPFMEPTSQSVEDGQALYLLFECWTCHGIDGRGQGPSARTLRDAKGRRITPADLTNPDYSGGSSSAEIRNTLLTGLTGTPMPAYQGIYLFAREDLEVINLSVLTEDRRHTVQRFISNLPAQSDLEGLSEERLTVLAQRNEWALVHYVQSLIRKKSWFDWAFRTSP